MSEESSHRSAHEPGVWTQLLESVAVNANDAVMISEAWPHDAPGPSVIYVNDAFTRMTGYEPEDVIEKMPRILQGPGTDRTELDKIRAALEAWEPVRAEVLNYRKDGTEFWVELDIVPVTDENGRVTHWVSVQRETTERRLAEQALAESERRFRSVVQNSSEVVKITDVDGTLRYASPAFERIFGYDPEEAAGTNILDYVHPDDLERIQEETEEALESPGVASNMVEYRFRHKNGSWRWVESIGTYLLDDPAVGGVVVNVRDITGRKQDEQALQESEQRLKAVASGAPVIMFVIDSDGVFTFESGAALQDLGLEPGASVGHSVFEAYSGFPKVLGNVRRALAGEYVVDTVEIGERAYHATYSPQFDEDGAVYEMIGVATDITERWKLERNLQHRATHDPLTGLANRRLLFARLAGALESPQSAEQQDESICLLYVDLNGFKEVNDRYGHEAGDALLAAVAGRIEGCQRPSDTAARVGGDEFCVLLEGASGTEEAARVAERLVASLETPFSVGNLTVEISASIGIAVKDKDSGSRSPDELMREADAAMYRAKSRGGHSTAWSR